VPWHPPRSPPAPRHLDLISIISIIITASITTALNTSPSLPSTPLSTHARATPADCPPLSHHLGLPVVLPQSAILHGLRRRWSASHSRVAGRALQGRYPGKAPAALRWSNQWSIVWRCRPVSALPYRVRAALSDRSPGGWVSLVVATRLVR
jgi:hypothetical protein